MGPYESGAEASSVWETSILIPSAGKCLRLYAGRTCGEQLLDVWVLMCMLMALAYFIREACCIDIPTDDGTKKCYD